VLRTHLSLATRREIDDANLLSCRRDDGPGAFAQTLQRLAERLLQRLEQLGPGAQSAMTLAEVLARELAEPLHAQLLQVVHRGSRPRETHPGTAAYASATPLVNVSRDMCHPRAAAGDD
jgi:hypothetical protein